MPKTSIALPEVAVLDLNIQFNVHAVGESDWRKAHGSSNFSISIPVDAGFDTLVTLIGKLATPLAEQAKNEYHVALVRKEAEDKAAELEAKIAAVSAEVNA